MGWTLWWIASAWAQGLDTHHPVVPSAGIAHENGPGSLWVNPANMSYDPDYRWGVFTTTPTPDQSSQRLALPTTTGFTLGGRGVGLGVHNLVREEADGDVRTDWSVDYATAVSLPERLSIGLLASWNFMDSSTNYFAYDAGASWRPLPWFGIGAMAQNVGDPDPSGIARPQSGAGIALRPLGRAALIGADWRRTFSPAGDVDMLMPTARLRPIEGLYLRGSAAVQLTEEVTLASVGVGIEVYMDGAGVAYHAGMPAGDADGRLLHTISAGSDEPGESLVRTGNEVHRLELDTTPPYQPVVTLFSSDPSTSWLDTLELIRRLEDDPSVNGLTLVLNNPQLTLARAWELRVRVEALEAAGKPVLAYLDNNAPNGAYYVASAASRIAVHPMANVSLIGFDAQLLTARGLLDLVGVEPQFVKVGTYKSAPETFTRVEPSEAALEQTSDLLDDLYTDLVRGVAAGREVDEDTVRRWIDGGPYDAREALDEGLVDGLAYADQLDDQLDELHDESPSVVDLETRPQPHSPWEDPQQIAIVYVTGPIISGESRRPGLLSGGATGSETVVGQLNRARNDRNVRAVVLRVDSPGGSVYASEEIWRAASKIAESDKPLVVSMGSYAASGGYYVSTPADAIWAEPSTVTGSIGVYRGDFDPSELLDRIGVNRTRVSRGRNSNLGSGGSGWDATQRQRLQELVERTYETFKERVADGRDMEIEEVEAVAQGRVWSGVDALDAGLVDGLGGLQDAIADARERAGIPAKRKVGLVTYSRWGSMLESLAPSVVTQVTWPLPSPLPAPRSEARRQVGEIAEVVRPWTTGLEPMLLYVGEGDEGVWAMEPFTRVIEGNGSTEAP